MTRGYSLEQDLRLLVNNPKYSDIEILCEDGKKLHGCRAILAARSEVFDRLFYNGMKESYENKISFPKINSAGMEIILEYIYQEDNVLLNLLVEAVANISLNNIKFGRLSITGLKCLLSYIYEKEKPFATPEYEVFRYSAILAAKQVSNDAHKTLTKLLPTLEKIENPIKVKNKFITDHRKVGKELEPLIKFIDFRRIKVQILADIIEPLEIVPDKIISNAYRYIALSNNLNLNNLINTRGTSINEIDYVWYKPAYRSKLRCTIAFENKGLLNGMLLLKKIVHGNQPTGWVFGSGCLYNPASGFYYCPSFHEDGARITVYLDMNKRTCAFTVNGKKYREVSE
ncbi:hypothetical protein GLOIN_2v1842735 [Rhizophagus irregularis DAOM 181602=DAOM 197198]|nr:hypothetical protein GLOIN_2v1842735 [Rhizophagus irregularis DAOM 181602=DAOM 197198]